MGTIEVEDIKERLSAIERQHSETATVVAVLNNQMEGVIKLLWMILGALIVGIVGAFITAWVKVPPAQQPQYIPHRLEAPR